MIEDFSFKKTKVPKTARQVCSATEVTKISDDHQIAYRPLVMGQVQKFPVDRRPQQRELSAAPQEEIDMWFQESEITIGTVADTLEKQAIARRLFFTWRDFFVKRMRDVQPTDLI